MKTVHQREISADFPFLFCIGTIYSKTWDFRRTSLFYALTEHPKLVVSTVYKVRLNFKSINEYMVQVLKNIVFKVNVPTSLIFIKEEV